jgi:hypothetical protein
MLLRQNMVALFASGIMTLTVPRAFSQTIPTVTANVSVSQSQYCSANSALGLSINFTGAYSATCSLAVCPPKSWGASPAKQSETATGVCNYVPPAAVAALLSLGNIGAFNGYAAVVAAAGWPNTGSPTFSYQYGINGSSQTSWAQPYYQNYVVSTLFQISYQYNGVKIQLSIPVGQPGVTTYTQDYMSCASQ